jgi:superfamily I DNA/RNA helicase
MELNAEQRRAVEAVRGPVCILAGAGSGKDDDDHAPDRQPGRLRGVPPVEILAVTFTDKAAGEMRARLEQLGVTGVRASTFHSAALSQLRYFRPEAVGRILPSKALVVRNLMNTLPARTGSGPPAISRPRSSGHTTGASRLSATWRRSTATTLRSRPT